MSKENQNPNDETGNVRVSLGERSYDIEIVTGQLPGFAGRLQAWLAARGFKTAAGQQSALIVTDGHVCHQHGAAVGASLHLAGFKCEVALLEPGEQSKSLAQASELYDRLVAMQADRQ